MTFQSHLDGSRHDFTPELSMEIQKALRSDMVMAFDECPPYPATEIQVQSAMKRTLDWAVRGLECPLESHQARFGIVQGGLYEELRVQSVKEITSLPFDGFAIGGLSIGESPELMQAMTRFVAPQLPADRPRYLMGVGRPQDLVEGVRAGVDLFDCVMPTRNARKWSTFYKPREGEYQEFQIFRRSRAFGSKLRMLHLSSFFKVLSPSSLCFR